MKLFKYDEFITESHLQLLLEANVYFKKDFILLLKKIDSPISKQLIDIEGKEIDINQNYIDINKDKPDTLFFKPDDKVGKVAKVKDRFGFYLALSYLLSKNSQSGFDKAEEDDFIEPEQNQVGQLIKTYNQEELLKILPDDYRDNIKYMYSTGRKFCIFQWVKNGKKHQILALDIALLLGEEAVKNSEVSVGRFVRALLTKSGIKFKDAEIEDFVYKYRAEVEKMKDALNKRFRVVKGDDIKKYYHRNKYESESGDLGNSCMRYDRCQMYLDIHTQNSQASLLLLMSETEEDKICGRAILWEMEPYEKSTKVMDRIYVIRTADQQLFKDWAIENGYWFKERQDFSEYTEFIFQDKETGEQERRQGEFSVKLDNGGEYPSYPYMDSFKYYNPRNGTLYNSSNFDYTYELTDTEGGNGSCNNCGGSGRVDCDDCDGDGEVGCNECDADGVVRCDECRGSGEQECNWCDGYGEKDCSTCDGEGKEDCEYCGGDGEDENGERCSECSGSGKKICDNCDGNGKRECNECDGDGTVKCDDCGGDGQVECSDCDGSGNRECYTCDGNGRHDCPDCS